MQKTLLAATFVMLVIAPAILLATVVRAEDQIVQIRISEAEMFRSPAYDAEVIRTALEGEEFVSVTKVGEFYLVADPITEAFLYLPFTSIYLIGEGLPDNMYISGKMPSPRTKELSYWQVKPKRQRVSRNRPSADGMLTAHNGKQYPAKYSYNKSYKPSVNGRQVVNDALIYRGVKYVLGGEGLEGIDCSGLTKVCLGNQGIGFTHRSSLQALNGKYIEFGEMQPGDLVYFRDNIDTRYLSHVGIYLGRGQFIHASQSAGKVVVSALSESYFKSHYAFARRL